MEITQLQLSIIDHFKNAINTCKENNEFISDQLSYINKVYSTLATDCMKDIDALINIITDNSLQMSDDERMKQIENI